MSERAERRASWTSDWTSKALVALPLLVACLLLLPTLGEFGLATRGEIAALDRTLAELGVPRSELERRPWLPDQLRTWSFVALGERDVGLRVPGALAAIGLVALAGLWARRLGLAGGRDRPASLHTLLPPLVALSLPLLLTTARTALGDPMGELFVAAAPLCLLEAGDAARRRALGLRVGLGLLGLVLLAAAIASLGVVLGGCLPLAIVALADPPTRRAGLGFASPRPLVVAAWAGAIACGLIGLRLGWSQGEGYIPLLGAAKDLARLDDPSKGDFTASLQAFGYQTFPFIGLVLVGALAPGRARLAALWLGTALALGGVWSLVYGPTPAPICVPVALLVGVALERMLDPREPIAARRLVLLLGLLGALILAKDGELTPGLIAWPLVHVPTHEFPAARIDAAARLDALAERMCALLLLAHVIAPPSADQLAQTAWRASRATRLQPLALRVEALLERASGPLGLARVRSGLPPLLLALALLGQAYGYGRVLLGEVGEQMSIAGPLRRWSAQVEGGAIPSPAVLGLHRIRDPGLEFYGPGTTHERFLANRSELEAWLFDDQPRSALIRRADLAPTYSSARGRNEPFYVLDDRHWDYVVVANFLPAGASDHNPLREHVVEVAPQLAHETLVGWEYFDLVAWEIESEGPLHRGAKATFHAVFRVKRGPPAGVQMYARLQQGKLSRVAAAPHDLTGGIYPPNHWRAGDIIHHRFEFEIPLVEVAWGEHELIVGMRRSEKANLKIVTPSGETGEHGVVLTGNKHEFAIIGTVDIAW